MAGVHNVFLGDAGASAPVTFTFAIATNQTNANLRTLAVAAGWNQSAPVSATLNSGIVISSNSTATPALTIDGSFPGGVTLINNGTIAGMGGNGGAGAGLNGNGSNGNTGATAINLGISVTIQNNGTVAGGGGGGGGGAGGQRVIFDDNAPPVYFAGGGGGGGRSGSTNSSGGTGTPAGGAGTFSAAGAGGASGSNGFGGSGGGWGSAGANGTQPTGSLITPLKTVGTGGGAGKCVNLNGFTVTWTATGTRLGVIS